MVEFDRSAFISKFQEEATDLLQRLNEGVIMLESEPGDAALVDRMLRDAHTLKGSSRMVGLLEISDIAHRLEDIMVRVRDKDMAYSAELSECFFEALDAMVYLSDNAGGDTSALDPEDLLARLAALTGGGRREAAEGVAHAVAAGLAAELKAAPPARAEEGAAGASPLTLPGGEPDRAQREETLHKREQTTVRIRTQQVDALLNLISEVVITQIKAEQRASELRAAATEMSDIWQSWVRLKAGLSAVQMEDESLLSTLSDDIELLDALLVERKRAHAAFTKDYGDDTSRSSTVVTDLQEQGMRLRMLPVSTVFNTFPRAMRELARSYRKDVDLIIEGGDTELDKKVLEEINDPLIHIMRNAVDHGLEPAEERRALGKSAKGTIRMSARQEGDHIVIEVADDGQGIDADAVRATAVRKGYVTENEAASMSDREATYLIFEKGFSTSPIITEISGRGVGMDVVREFIVEKLKGSLDVESTSGEGTRFRLTIPLTLAIIRALMLQVGGQVFALPTASVEETLRIDPSSMLKVEGREVIRRQRRTVPLVRLGDILALPSEAAAPGSKVPIATVGFSGHRMGFIVDALLGEQQIVIKNLGTHLCKVDNVAGVTILGAGEVVPILNVPDLMANARTLTGARRRESAAEESRGPRRVLICEDSFTTRELERSIFEAAGYEVEVAMDGAAGLTKLREGLKVDAVVTDVQMPNLTGFELTRAIKGDPVLEQIPVVIVTSLERDEEKAEGIEAGADAYITKSVFNQDTLLDTVERLIH
ncbi:MAG: hybrid sensor histidine kinase/response regulator [Coriobacteriia bacterium]|nr:hybrid sensor histidine kinase/response regulator [Coriobacteriia bacterium]